MYKVGDWLVENEIPHTAIDGDTVRTYRRGRFLGRELYTMTVRRKNPGEWPFEKVESKEVEEGYKKDRV